MHQKKVRDSAAPTYVKLVVFIMGLEERISHGQVTSTPMDNASLGKLIRMEGVFGKRFMGDYLGGAKLRGFYDFGPGGPYVTSRGEEFLRANRAAAGYALPFATETFK